MKRISVANVLQWSPGQKNQRKLPTQSIDIQQVTEYGWVDNYLTAVSAHSVALDLSVVA